MRELALFIVVIAACADATPDREVSHFVRHLADAGNDLVVEPRTSYADNVRAYHRAIGRLDLDIAAPQLAEDVATAITQAWRRLGVLVDGPVGTPPVRAHVRFRDETLDVAFVSRGLRITLRRTATGGSLELRTPTGPSYGAALQLGFAWENGAGFAYRRDGDALTAREPVSDALLARLQAIVRRA